MNVIFVIRKRFTRMKLSYSIKKADSNFRASSEILFLLFCDAHGYSFQCHSHSLPNTHQPDRVLMEPKILNKHLRYVINL